ncbi:nucleoside triphosphatase YtkD [Neobacillus drentensis]|uniref:RNA deprotection pyrophosphohydrolase n=1 Tax=Neobacillus drentensis TaxID=220684 RepID=UPI002FFDF1A9
MIQFFDQNRNKVELDFKQKAFKEEAKHVLVICQQGDKWLLTNHKKRGFEFPGGKVEPFETLEEAARRETFEETGAILGQLQFVAEYKVSDQNSSFVKAVFWGQVKEMDRTNNYHETNGPVMFEGDVLELRMGNQFSFIMKDQVIEECIHYIKQKSKE